MRMIWWENGTYDTVKEYLVQYKNEDGSIESHMKTANEIIDMISMHDYYPVEFKVYDVEKTFGRIYKLDVHGTWHDFKNPLYIKVTYKSGKIAFDGYGTDH